jgi:predicted flap endonuclease-1-like 5' DNA nuclease
VAAAAHHFDDEPGPEVVVAPPAAPARDDLTRVHGIGPKYADLLVAAGITSYDDLAAATPDQLRDIIRPSAMQQINFASWSAQAAALAATRTARVGDDLTELEGIGPVYAAKLRDRGIVSFADLAASDEATLAEIIAAPTWRRINYADWIAQARLAAAGDEAGLREMQDTLFRRGGDNLSLIQGLGGRSAAALQAAGIATFAALAATPPEQIDGILRDAGLRGGYDYNAWIGEAGLRAAGKRVPSGRARPTYVVPCPQDLSAVHGVGPVFEERLYAAGIGTYWSLAELPDADLMTILDVRDFQGVDLAAIKAAAMRLAVESNSLGRAWDGTPPDDFDGLPGIGEVYERRLYEAGICTYAALAAASPERLAEVCKAPAGRTPDFAAWIALAAELAGARSG